jgi:hypothetical protein
MHCWDTTPRLTFLSPEPGSGKSRALELTEALAPSPILVANVTPAYLFRRAAQEQVTLLVDEADTVFSVKSAGSEKIRDFLNASHRRGNSAGYCIGQGTNITPEDSPCFVAVALAALALRHMPETLMSRSIIIHMRRRAQQQIIDPLVCTEVSIAQSLTRFGCVKVASAVRRDQRTEASGYPNGSVSGRNSGSQS